MGRQIRESSTVAESGLVAGNGARAGNGNAFLARARVTDSDLCPCGGGLYGQCCGSLHRGKREAATAAELMAVGYSAYAARKANYIWRTWHPYYRPEVTSIDDGMEWEGLTIINAVDDGEDSREGTMEFEAVFHNHGGIGTVHRRSRFIRRVQR